MQKLNLPGYSFKTKHQDEKLFIWDNIRKKYVVLTPEEWVRQNFINFLIYEKSYIPSLISVEHELKLNTLSKRCDILVFAKSGRPVLLVECKNPSIDITQDVFDQIARYNLVLHVEYLIVTNGLSHYCCKIDYYDRSYSYLKEIPSLKEIGTSFV